MFDRTKNVKKRKKKKEKVKGWGQGSGKIRLTLQRQLGNRFSIYDIILPFSPKHPQ